MVEVAERIKWESKRLQVWSLQVCVLSTDKGTVQKVIVLPRDDLQTEELVLEEVEVFKVSFYFPLLLYICLPSCHNILVVSVLLLRRHCTHNNFFLLPIKVPTPITTMKISSKRVSMPVQLFLTFAHTKRKETIFQRKAMEVMQFGKVTS